MKTTAPLAEKIASHVHETPDDAVVSSLQQSVRKEKKGSASNKTLLLSRYSVLLNLLLKKVHLAAGLTVLPIDEVGFTLNTGKFSS